MHNNQVYLIQANLTYHQSCVFREGQSASFIHAYSVSLYLRYYRLCLIGQIFLLLNILNRPTNPSCSKHFWMVI